MRAFKDGTDPGGAVGVSGGGTGMRLWLRKYLPLAHFVPPTLKNQKAKLLPWRCLIRSYNQFQIMIISL